jgi:Caspase domain
MAAKLGIVKYLVLGLAVASWGLLALTEHSEAGRRAERRAARRAQEAAIVHREEPVQPRTKPKRSRPQTVRSRPAPSRAPSSEEVAAIANTQRCLSELGYYSGEIDGKKGRATWSAYWQFKREHGLSSHSDLLAEPVQEKLAELCQSPADEPAPEQAAAEQVVAPLGSAEDEEENVALASPEISDAAAIAPNIEDEEPVPVPPVRLDCLTEDLAKLLRRAHGVAVKSCDRPCVAAPKGLRQGQLDELQATNGVVWCSACVPIAGHLALDDVLRIERAGNVELCSTPQRQLLKYGAAAGDLRSYMQVRELYRALPPAAENPNAIAVIIGNRGYERLPRSITSQNDADAVYIFLTEHLGYRPDNIIDMRDAKRADLEKVFGAEPGLEGDLGRMVEEKPAADVLVYYSGYGATDETDSYLLPVDIEPYGQASGGYRLSTLYANLTGLQVNSVLVLLETEYGPDHGASVLPPNLPETAGTVLPQTPTPALTVLAATDRGQRSLVDVTYDIGLFTRYLIEGLAGGADLPPGGNGDGALDSVEIYVFTASLVDLSARKTYGVLQHPIYSGTTPNVLVSARSAPAN